VDRASGIFETAWKIGIFHSISADLGSTKSPVATDKKGCAKGFACVGRRIFSPNLAMLCS
jgi:hypothetical protein